AGRDRRPCPGHAHRAAASAPRVHVPPGPGDAVARGTPGRRIRAGSARIVKNVGVSDIPRRNAARTAKLASLPLGVAGRAAAGLGRRMSGQTADEINADLAAKAADQLFTVLGELKGGAMKLGQAMSVFEAAMPDELAGPYREALTKLQRDAPPMTAHAVHRVLDQQLGTKWRSRFTRFDDEPTAAASIGQVHRAVWSDGRPVAVKIQYPGADEALRSDLRQLRRLTP